MFKRILYNGMSRSTMVRSIHMECDTSSFTYSLNDNELIALFKQIFKGDKHMLAPEDVDMVVKQWN
jgi:hypothetical protein